jgi:hypothetical protein
LDSEKFDKVVLDLLYDELDELTRAAALRHIESSARARHIYSELRATREVGAVPLVEPPPDLTDRILDAERVARADRSLRSRIGSAVSILAGYAMRPQLAMAALLMLMIGSSLIFLRARRWPSRRGPTSRAWRRLNFCQVPRDLSLRISPAPPARNIERVSAFRRGARPQVLVVSRSSARNKPAPRTPEPAVLRGLWTRRG